MTELQSKRLGDIDTFHLPVGIIRPDKNYTEILLDEWRPIDKAKLTSPLFKKNPYAGLTDILRRLVQEIPGLMPRKSDAFSLCSEHYFKDMFQADRDYILLQAISLSGETSQVIDFDCPSCNAELQEDVNLDDVKVFFLGDNDTYVDFQLPVGIKVERDGETVLLKDFRYSLPTGATQEQIAKYAHEGEFAVTNRILANQLTAHGYGKIPYEVIQRMGNKDHKVLLKVLGELIPGPDMTLHLDCPQCLSRFSTSLNLQRFLV